MPTIRQMEYAVSVDRERHFGRASKRCFVSQPTLSMQLQKLEDELGVVLFDRSRKPVVPTREGALLLIRFRKILDACEEVESLIDDMRGKVSGTYRIGIIPTMASTVLPPLLQSVLQKYPDLRILAEESTTQEILVKLERDELDAGILATPLDPPAMETFPILREELVLYVSPEIPVEVDEKGRVDLKSLPETGLLLMGEGHCLRTQTVDFCELRGQAGRAQRFRFEAGSLDTLCAMVESGAFYSLIPKLHAAHLERTNRGGRVFSISGETPWREIGLVSRKIENRQGIRNAIVDSARSALLEQNSGLRPADAQIKPIPVRTRFS